MSLETTKISSGLTLHVDHIPGTTESTANMFIPFGSVHEQVREEGIAHALEHCVFLQTEELVDRDAISMYATVNQLDCNARAYYTRTLHYADGANLAAGLTYLNETVLHPGFPEQLVLQEMKAIRREALTKLDEIDSLHIISSHLAVFGKPYGRNAMGYRNNLNFDAARLDELHKKYYQLGKMTLVVAGNARLDKVVELAERLFHGTDIPEQPSTPPLTVALGQHRTTGFVREDSENVRLKVSYPMSPDFRTTIADNTSVYNVAFKVLSSYCFRALRYRENISYNGAVDYSDYNHPNAWDVFGHVTIDGENVEKALDIFDEVFSKPGSDYSKDRLAGELESTKNDFRSVQRSPDGRAGCILKRKESYGEPIDYFVRRRRLERLQVDDVRTAIDGIVGFVSQTPKYTHITGKRSAIGDVERIIELDEFA